ncbi:phage integrase N-terminal SAM-like domain-containing protein [Nodosilinea sp. LEGE 07088]|uniref:site-specific integrase n=1 Tax=Nodosilinea sp. LEGE 07088 TaxID=2777968 RepID=UPI00188020AC|nr:phage integrase N-terminal SAM-like domain-containing protein [Nodosilinea sp. LEGE 07088]
MPSPQPPRLLDQVREAIRLRHFSFKTEKSYVHYVRDFILFHNKRRPKEIGADEIRAYLSHLAIERNVAPSTQTVALSAKSTFPLIKGGRGDHRGVLCPSETRHNNSTPQ